MIRRIAVISGLGALLLATVAWTQMEIRGVVSYVDSATRTVYFTDGRVIQLQPGATLTINGQPVVLESVRPGATAVLLPPPGSTTTVTTVTQQPQVAPPPPPPLPAAAPTVVLPPSPSPVSATGTIAGIDPANQTIVFQDGRIVRVTPNTMVWQQAPAISSLQPGARVFVRDAMPVAYLPSGATTPAPTGQYLMGTVARVEPAAQEVVLSNGAIVHVGPTAVLRSGNGGVAITQLRPGDEVVVQVTNPARVVTPSVSVVTAPVPSTADRYAGSALPYQSYADTRIEAAGVQIIWSPQTQ
jgi:Domain of unknown function (DUF5666)